MFFWKKDKTKNFAKLSKSEREELARQLLAEVNQALEKGKLEAALEALRQLIRLEPEDADHRRRLADCQGKLGDKKAELEARCKAATLYAEAGFLLKGIAMCKLALAIDPNHRETLKQLAELNELTGRGDPPEAPPLAFSPEEAKTRKDEALAEARARVERVLAEREKRAARMRRAETPDDAAPPPSRSFSEGAPLGAVPLQSVLPRLSRKPSKPAIDPSSSSQEHEDADESEEEDDDDIFIAPLDEEEDGLAEAGEAPGPPRADVASALRRVPLLSDLKPETFIALVDQVGFRELEEGEVLFEVGSPADAMYCVVEGEVAASLPAPGGGALELARLGEGEFFGEIGLIAEQPRQASISATKQTMLLVFPRHLVQDLSGSEPDFVKILLRFVRERLVASLIASNPLFAPFSGAEAQDLTRRFQFLEVKARKPLIRQGSPSGGVFLLLTGTARVVLSRDGAVQELGRLGPGDMFGEMSLINRQDASASVITEGKCFVLELPARDFTQLVMMHPALLDYIATMAAERERRNEALLSGAGSATEDRLSLM